MKTKLRCPKCRRGQLGRVKRRGFLRVQILPLLGVYPWECLQCRREYLLRRRGAGYRKTKLNPDIDGFAASSLEASPRN